MHVGAYYSSHGSFGGGEPQGVTLVLIIIALVTVGIAWLLLMASLVVMLMDGDDALELKIFIAALLFAGLSALSVIVYSVGALTGWWPA